MIYQISSDNIQMSESMVALTKEKFQKIESRLEQIPEGSKYIRVVLNSAPEDKFQVRALVRFHKREYHSDETDFNLEHALIKVVNEITRMMEKDKDKWEQWEREARDVKRSIEEGLVNEVEENVKDLEMENKDND